MWTYHIVSILPSEAGSSSDTMINIPSDTAQEPSELQPQSERYVPDSDSKPSFSNIATVHLSPSMHGDSSSNPMVNISSGAVLECSVPHPESVKYVQNSTSNF